MHRNTSRRSRPTLLMVAALVVATGCSEPPVGPQVDVSYDAIPTANPNLSPSIVVIVNAIPEGIDEHNFSLMWRGKSITDFALNDDGGLDSVPQQQVFTGLKPGIYTISRTIEVPYTLFEIDCVVSPGGKSTWSADAVAGTAIIDYRKGDTVTCSFGTAQIG